MPLGPISVCGAGVLVGGGERGVIHTAQISPPWLGPSPVYRDTLDKCLQKEALSYQVSRTGENPNAPRIINELCGVKSIMEQWIIEVRWCPFSRPLQF